MSHEIHDQRRFPYLMLYLHGRRAEGAGDDGDDNPVRPTAARGWALPQSCSVDVGQRQGWLVSGNQAIAGTGDQEDRTRFVVLSRQAQRAAAAGAWVDVVRAMMQDAKS